MAAGADVGIMTSSARTEDSAAAIPSATASHSQRRAGSFVDAAPSRLAIEGLSRNGPADPDFCPSLLPGLFHSRTPAGCETVQATCQERVGTYVSISGVAIS